MKLTVGKGSAVTHASTLSGWAGAESLPTIAGGPCTKDRSKNKGNSKLSINSSHIAPPPAAPPAAPTRLGRVDALLSLPVGILAAHAGPAATLGARRGIAKESNRRTHDPVRDRAEASGILLENGCKR